MKDLAAGAGVPLGASRSLSTSVLGAGETPEGGFFKASCPRSTAPRVSRSETRFCAVSWDSATRSERRLPPSVYRLVRCLLGLAAAPGTPSHSRRPVKGLIVRMTRENSPWGHRRIQASWPVRATRSPTWRQFLTAQAHATCHPEKIGHSAGDGLGQVVVRAPYQPGLIGWLADSPRYATMREAQYQEERGDDQYT